MIPQKNDFVIVYLNNGYSESGYVEEWGEQVVLVNDHSITVIKNPDDIFLFKIRIEKQEEPAITNSTAQQVFIDKQISSNKRSHIERLGELAQQRVEIGNQERMRVKDYINGKPSGKRINYESIYRDESLPIYPSKKNR